MNTEVHSGCNRREKKGACKRDAKIFRDWEMSRGQATVTWDRTDGVVSCHLL